MKCEIFKHTVTYLVICFWHIRYIECKDTLSNVVENSPKQLDWNLYEVGKQQILDYSNLEEMKDDIIKYKDDVIQEIGRLKKKAASKENLDDKFQYLFTDILKHETKKSTASHTHGSHTSRRKKRSNDERISQQIQTIHGGWSPWSNVATPCNATCGGGKMMRRRSCTNPTPQVSKVTLQKYEVTFFLITFNIT